MKKTLTFSLCAVLVSALAYAADDAMTQEGTGSAAVAGRGEEKAFEEAKKLALRDAVEKAAGVLIQGDSLTLNSQLVRDRVFATSQGYVKKHDVVSKKNDPHVIACFTNIWLLDPLVHEAATNKLLDMSPIARLVVEPALVVVRTDSPFKTLKEFIDAAKAKPPPFRATSSRSPR